MGRADVRAAAQAYFNAMNLPFVGRVYPSRPYIIDETDYEMTMSGSVVTSASGSGAVLVINLPEDHRQRMAITGRSFVEDKVEHQVVLELFFANTSQDAIAAQNDHDTLIDAIVTGIRKDPNLGNPATVWSAGEFAAGVAVHQHEPFTSPDGSTIFMPATIVFDTWEWVSGPTS